jgi:hypothetical protein
MGVERLATGSTAVQHIMCATGRNAACLGYNPGVRGLATECHASRAAKPARRQTLGKLENKKRAAGTRRSGAFLLIERG